MRVRCVFPSMLKCGSCGIKEDGAKPAERVGRIRGPVCRPELCASIFNTVRINGSFVGSELRFNLTDYPVDGRLKTHCSTIVIYGPLSYAKNRRNINNYIRRCFSEIRRSWHDDGYAGIVRWPGPPRRLISSSALVCPRHCADVPVRRVRVNNRGAGLSAIVVRTIYHNFRIQFRRLEWFFFFFSQCNYRGEVCGENYKSPPGDSI